MAGLKQILITNIYLTAETSIHKVGVLVASEQKTGLNGAT